MISRFASRRLIRGSHILATFALLAACAVTAPPGQPGSTEPRRRPAEDRPNERAWLGYGTLVGVVTDTSGEGIAEARIKLGSSGYAGTTNEGGGFTIPDILPAQYPLIAGAGTSWQDTLPYVGIAASETTFVRISLEHASTPDAARGARFETPAWPGYGTIVGAVTDETGQPLPGVAVWIPGTRTGATTGADGSYRIRNLLPGTYDVRAQLIGYVQVTRRRVESTSGTAMRVDFSLDAMAIHIDRATAPDRVPSRRHGDSPRETPIAAEDELERPTIEGTDLDAAGTAEALEADLSRADGAMYEMASPTGRAAGSPVIDARESVRSAAPQVKAGTHDDNEEYPSWLRFLGRTRHEARRVLHRDFSGRIIVRVEDADGRPVMNEPYRVVDEPERTVWSGRTYANGESVVYTRAFIDRSITPDGYRVVVPRIGTSAGVGPDGIATVRLATRPEIPQTIPVDVAFIVDATGSMGDEIQRLRDVLFSIHRRLRNASDAADIRFGMVVYRDRGDREPLRVVPFTADVDSFEMALAQVRAEGGGDYAEDVQAGLMATLDSLDWRDDGVRSAFLIADAPPHTNYRGQQNYLASAREANERSIRINAVGASGLSIEGEYAFRQIAAATYGQFIFLTYGESGDSEGRGTPSDPGRVSHHTGSNWASRRLDDIVVDLVRRDLAYQTDVLAVASDTPAPDEQYEHLSLRMADLWDQIARQLANAGGDSVTAVLLPFDVATPDTVLADYLRDLSTETIVRQTRLRLIERDRLAAILAEHELAMGGLVGPDAAVELGNLLNSRIVLAGRIYRLGIDRVMHIRAVDVETARIVAAARIRV